jgi:asparagine synthase (glutamine-hydrolysing)
MFEFALEQLYEISNQRNIEKIYPFLDKRILKFALNVPTNMKLRNGVTRYYFKEAMKDLFPYELYKRQTKSNISPFANNQIQDNLDAILDEIFQNQSPVESYISKEKLNSFRNKKLNHAEMLIVYNLYNLNYWLKTQIN